MLHVVQGHPKLMELADAAAASPARLTAQLEAAETAAGGQALDMFFRDGVTALDAAQFLGALTGWTGATLAGLPAAARLMAQFLACLEQDDRRSWIIDANWADLWRRLGQPGDPPGPAPLLAALAAAALIQPDPPPGQDQDSPAPVTYRMHPGIAQAIRADAGPEIQAATDTELAVTWTQVSQQALHREGGEAGHAIIRAGLAAAPYLLRLQDWDTAGFLLEQALRRDESPATIQVALPALRAISDATQAPENLSLLARAMASINPAEAETLLRASLARATADENFISASATAWDLANLLRDVSRLPEALDLANQAAQYSRQAGLRPWNQLADRARVLQILGLIGQHRQVLDEIPALLDQMDKLPAPTGDNATVEPWNVREGILDTGCTSAQALGEWQQQLDLNAANLASKRARGADAYEITRFRYNDARPLMELGRLDDAERILLETQQAYEDQNDINRLQRVLSTRAFLEDIRGRPQQALELQRTAIRLAYIRPIPRDIAISHQLLWLYLHKAGLDPVAARAHLLAAALLFQLTGMTHELAGTSGRLAKQLRQSADRDDLPGTLDEVIRVAEQTEGVHLDQLITALQPDRQAVADTLAEILRAAANTNPRQDPPSQDQLQQWEPVIAATVAAAGGDSDATAQLAPVLDQLAQDSDWAALAAVLRRIIDGDRDDSLLQGLDPVGTVITSQVLARLAQPPDTFPREDP